MKNFIGAEWKEHFTNKKILIPVLAVLFIPLMYSGMFLWAFWDPYERLDDLPVAVVNLDEGAQIEKMELAIGEDLSKNLKDNPSFQWEFVNKEEAYQGLENQKYYMVIEIPEDFSKRATTLLDEKPFPMELKYVPNESYNFLSAQIGSTAVEKIKEEVSNELTATYAEEMFANIEKLGDGFSQAADGTHQLNEGVAEIQSGSGDLKEALSQAAEKSISFSQGMAKAYGGVQEIYIGNEKLANGLGDLEEGHGRLADGAERALAGTRELSDGASATQAGIEKAYDSQQQLAGAASQLHEGSKKLAAGGASLQEKTSGAAVKAEQFAGSMKEFDAVLQPLLDDATPEERAAIEAYLKELVAGSDQFSQGMAALDGGVRELQNGLTVSEASLAKLAGGEAQLSEGLAALVNGSGKLTAGTNELLKGQTELTSGIARFGDGLTSAADGSRELSAGGKELVNGMGVLDDGSKQFSDGTSKLAEGSSALNEGIGKLGEGSHELESKLTDAADQAGAVKADEETFGMFADPVKVKSEVANGVPNYGTGFAPYFLSLGLFVGALLLSIVYPLRDTVGIPSSGTGWFLGKLSVLVAVGVVQALLADAVLLFGLGIEVQSVSLFVVFSILTSLAFIALVQFLVTLLGDPGRFVAIIILILQLTTSAGTFPLELIPGALQVFNAFLPMTYSVAGFKAIISSGDYGFMWENAAVLAGFMGVLMFGTWMYFIARFKKIGRLIEE
ncbi:YhgE/Pip family protein [Sutcliffiella sp. NPDC057660]|uniref:YhgE/Pip family protein n=1 Tax=Sutcliffiella sp. NPDC057660 TaxID=3346199 RepID=UPI0036D0EB3D